MMMLPHLGPWIGALAGLRMVVAGMTLFAAWRFRSSVARVVRFRFNATSSDMTYAPLSILSLGVFLLSVFSLSFIARKGYAPTDLILWSRITATAAWVTVGTAYTLLIVGITSRASGKDEGRKALRRVGVITACMMGIGAFL